MEAIRVEFAHVAIGGKPGVCMKVLDERWDSSKEPTLFAEAAEGLLRSSLRFFVFDCSQLTFVTSVFFGALANLQSLAVELKKTATFRFSPEVMETVRMAGFDKTLDITY